MEFLSIEPGTCLGLASSAGQPEQVHVFDERSIPAINAALAARRPLLVLGEPGTGKSQLARAAAKALGRAYCHRVVDARAEAQDLLWHFDAVSRLAEAQLAGALKDTSVEQVRERLALANYLRPGPLWWALNWNSARAQAIRAKVPEPHQPDKGDPAKGCVVLIDEIDKAEPELPNGLLEVLGSGEFTPPGWDAPIQAVEPAPLIVITSNEERALPAAFLRRCLVLRLSLPSDRDALVAHLVERGQAHFQRAHVAMLTKAAAQLVKDREAVGTDTQRPRPGLAEYLDLVRAIVALASDDPTKQDQIITEIAPYVLKAEQGEA